MVMDALRREGRGHESSIYNGRVSFSIEGSKQPMPHHFHALKGAVLTAQRQ